MTAAYNYETFDGEVESGREAVEFAAFRDLLHAGDKAPDAKLTRLEDQMSVELSQLWRDQHTVLEFGSFT